MSVHYEKTDVTTGAVVRVGVIVFAVALVGSLILLPLMSLLETRWAATDPPTPPLTRFEPGRRPPEPRLQQQPFDDVRDLHAAEAAWLGGYGWVDRQAGIVRIPIEDAMSLVLERGLPARPDAEAAQSPQTAQTDEDLPAPPAAPPQEGGH